MNILSKNPGILIKLSGVLLISYGSRGFSIVVLHFTGYDVYL
jgi:hypothetical protein